MASSYYTSNAEWPVGTCHEPDGKPFTKDSHETMAQAKAVCELLEKEGYGGEGKIFPDKTWVAYVSTN